MPESTKRKLLLLSNGSQAGQGYLEYARGWIAEHFKASLESPKTILFIPYALKDWDVYTKKAAEALKPLGVTVISVNEAKDPCTLLDRVDGVFIGGGNTFRLLDQLQKTGLLEAIRKKVEQGMPYMGASAGINVVAPTIRTTNDMPIVQPESFRAMGLVPFQINPHYVDGRFYYEENGKMGAYNGESRAQRIAEFHEENTLPVLGIKEGNAVRIEGHKAELLGGKTAVLFQRDKEPMELKDAHSISALLARMQGAESVAR